MSLTPEQKEFFRTIPKKWMGSGALFFNSTGEFMIVKPTYKEGWEIPGGRVEEGESPFNAMVREVQEELGLALERAELLCVEYTSNNDEKGDRLHFIFDGGELNEGQIASIKLQESELSEYRFVPLEDFRELVGLPFYNRISAALQGKKENKLIYVENI